MAAAVAILQIFGQFLIIFFKNSARRDEILKSARAFLAASANDSIVSSELREEYERMKLVDPWLFEEEENKEEIKPNEGE